MAAKNNLITGITDLLVLSILKEKGDSYVYDVSKYIASSSKGLLSISHNTVYTVMYKLEEGKMVSEYAKLVGKKRSRVYYHIEPAGEAYLDKLAADYHNMVNGVKNIFGSFQKEVEPDG